MKEEETMRTGIEAWMARITGMSWQSTMKSVVHFSKTKGEKQRERKPITRQLTPTLHQMQTVTMKAIPLLFLPNSFPSRMSKQLKAYWALMSDRTISAMHTSIAMRHTRSSERFSRASLIQAKGDGLFFPFAGAAGTSETMFESLSEDSGLPSVVATGRPTSHFWLSLRSSGVLKVSKIVACTTNMPKPIQSTPVGPAATSTRRPTNSPVIVIMQETANKRPVSVA
mmetsp:Transcript_68543/g.149730  ORF Transcript_68543/g.149730 Transcript_68543/m.149730 type:complete len:226 (-) Transcript_68543:579-1256(-)